MSENLEKRTGVRAKVSRHICTRALSYRVCVGYLNLLKVLGSNLQYNLTLDAPWKAFQDRDVHNVNEAAKLVYDVDTQLVVTETKFMVFENRLRELNDMATTLEACSRIIQELTKGQQQVTRWKAVAKRNRNNMRQAGEGRLKVAKKHFLTQRLHSTLTSPPTSNLTKNRQKENCFNSTN